MNPYHSVYPSPIDDIEQLSEAKVIGAILNGKFHFDFHLQFISCLRCQRLYLTKLLRKQGLPPKKMCIAFQAIFTSNVQYQHGTDLFKFMATAWKRRIVAFLLQASRSGLCSDLNFDPCYLPLKKFISNLFVVKITVFILLFQ
jgi:hypothetical protein